MKYTLSDLRKTRQVPPKIHTGSADKGTETEGPGHARGGGPHPPPEAEAVDGAKTSSYGQKLHPE